MRQFNLSEWAVEHQTFTLFLIILTVVCGIFSFTKLGRLEDPNFTVPGMSISVAWPGATAEQIETQVINPIESQLREIDHFYFARSFSRQGYGAIIFQMKGGLSSAQLKASWHQARKKVDDIESSFPQGVLPPQFNDEYSDVYTALIALHAKDLSPTETLEFAQKIKRQLQIVPDIKKINILGAQDEKIFVEFSSKKLASQGIPLPRVLNAIKQQNTITPSGMRDTETDRVFVRISGPYTNVDDIKNTPIQTTNGTIALGDIAHVYSGYQDPPSLQIRHQGQNVIVIGVTIQPNANVITFGTHLNKTMQDIRAQLPVGVELTQFADQPAVVADSIWEFERAFLEALVIVLIVSFLSLGARPGFIVALSIPLVLGIVAVVMFFNGWNLDRITLGALIISLGLLVDDAIISVEMMTVKIEEGLSHLKAATFAYTSTAFPMLTGTLITMAGFMPVGFNKSNAGVYAGGIFWILATALIISWLVAVIFVPYLGIKLLKPTVHSSHHDPYQKPFYARMRHGVDFAISHKWLIIGGTVGLFLIALVSMRFVQQQFFPTASRTELIVDLRLAQGSSFSHSYQKALLFEQKIKNNPDVTHFTTYIGAGSPKFFISLLPELPNAGLAQIVIQTPNLAARERLRAQLLHLFATDPNYTDLHGRVQRLEFGPPVGFPVQFRVIGDDLDQVRDIAYQVTDIMKRSPLIRDTQLEWNEKVRTLSVHINQNKAQQMGLSSVDIGNAVQAVLDGIPISTIPQGENDIGIVVRADSSERNHIGNLADITLFSQSGARVPLGQVATIAYTYEDPVRWRRNRLSNITVNADLADGIQAPYASTQLMKQLKPIIDKLPTGYQIQMGGAIEESLISNKAIAAVFPAMIFTILILLMLQLHSFSTTFMVFLTAPLGLIGVVPALLIFNRPFGFVALVGVIALSGMVMRNSVILVDQIEQDIRLGKTIREAIIEATIRRFRPVVLTAMTAFLAMIPLSRSVFWGPMATAIMGGLLAGTVLTLIVVPALYAAWFKVQSNSEKSVQTSK